MGTDVSRVLGRPELAGGFVSPKGTTMRMTAGTAGAVVGGLVGTAAAAAIEGRGSSSSDLPSFGNIGYLAVTDTELALLRAKHGAFKAKVTDEVLARVPRTAIADVRFDSGWLSRLSIRHADGTLWQFEIPRICKKGAVATVRALAQA
jgi:hypothetical protein